LLADFSLQTRGYDHYDQISSNSDQVSFLDAVYNFTYDWRILQIDTNEGYGWSILGKRF